MAARVLVLVIALTTTAAQLQLPSGAGWDHAPSEWARVSPSSSPSPSPSPSPSSLPPKSSPLPPQSSSSPSPPLLSPPPVSPLPPPPAVSSLPSPPVPPPAVSPPPLPPAASRPPSPSSAPPPAPPPSGASRKRGFVGSACASGSGCNDAALLPGLYWYGYNPTDVYHGAAGVDEAALFVPMYHCTSSLSQSIQSGLKAPVYVLGFNECNLASQCQMSAQAAATAMKQIMDANPAALLVSPSTAGDGTSWYADFFAACTSLYGAGGCRISAIAAHAYSCTPSSTLAYLQKLHDTFALPIWLTEFSCGAHSAGRPTADHEAFMRGIVPLLEAAPFVQRYFWMSARDTSSQRNLVVAGSSGPASALTPLGRLYLSL